jgi:hypothetical protein
LPTGFDTLRAEARAEGFRQVERLAADWEAGTTRLTVMAKYCLPHGVNGVLAGIGGLMLEPVITDALRMRRFYARPAYRRSGGRGLALAAHAEKWQWRENSS